MMILKKVILFICAAITLAFGNRDSAIKNTSVVVTNNSSLIVKGTTNVNSFSCAFDINKFKNPIQVTYHIEDSKMKFNKTALILEAKCFDCGGKSINSDFQSILKSDKYPQITLFLKEIRNFENPDVKALIDIQIAGVNNSYQIPIKFKNNKEMLVTGDLSLNLSDFNIQPVKKFLGLVSVNDKIQINFQLAIKENY